MAFDMIHRIHQTPILGPSPMRWKDAFLSNLMVCIGPLTSWGGDLEMGSGLSIRLSQQRFQSQLTNQKLNLFALANEDFDVRSHA